jgi:hypothetical protein
MEPSAEILELHLLEPTLLQQAGVPCVVVKHLSVPVFLSCPQIVPASPEAFVAQVYGQQAVEVGQPLLSQEVQSQSSPGVIWNACGLLAKLGDVGVGALVRRGAHQVGRKPELPLPLMYLHQLLNLFLKVLKYFDLRVEFAGRFCGEAHGYPSKTFGKLRTRRTSL